MEELFYFDGWLRWNLGWPSPNFAGAFLAMVLCYTWRVARSNWAKLLLILCEAIIVVLIVKTYSRGSLVGCGVILALSALITNWKKGCERFIIIYRVVLILSVVNFSGMSRRIAPDYVINDKSIGNRMKLWEDGLAMLASHPNTGWGLGTSGRIYEEYYRDLNAEPVDMYTTLVNSYLTVAAEIGIPLLIVALVAITFLSLVGLSGFRNDCDGKGILRCSALVLIVWLVVNVFSTLSYSWLLWIMPVIACIHLIVGVRYYGVRSRVLVLCGCWATGVGVVSASFLYIGSACAAKRLPYNVSSKDNRWIRKECKGGYDGIWKILPDRDVLGELPGREVARWIQAGAIRTTFDMCTYPHLLPEYYQLEERCRALIICGRQAQRLGDLSFENTEILCVVHPMVPPPHGLRGAIKGKTIIVLLPGVDELGLGGQWVEWAHTLSASIIITSDRGLDLSGHLPRDLLSKLAR